MADSRKVLILLVVFASAGLGQSGKAELFGTVLDPSNAVVPRTRIEATNQATGATYSGTSNEQGEYHLLGLAPGDYAVTARASGFVVFRRTGLMLHAGDQAKVDVALTLAGSEAVDVVAQAVPLLQAASGTVSFTVDRQRIETLPLDGRNFIPLVALSPGVALPSGSLLPRINGSRPRTNEFLYDGISVLQPEPGQVVFYPIIDAMEEFRVNINAYSAEYGRSNGGTVMVIGKSGGNELHGTLFEFFRNEALNARNRFAQPGPNPEFRRNQYGLTIGGPIQKNKTFFFGAWQGTRLRTGITRFSTVPTDAQRSGQFTSTVKDPSTGQPFPNNKIPEDRFDPIATQVLDHYPHANLLGTANNYVRTAVEPDNQDQFDARLDHYFGTQHRVFGRYSYFLDNNTPVTPLPDGSGSLTSGVLGRSHIRGDNAVFEYSWTVSPAVLNQVRFGYSRRALTQAALQNGNITVPGLPANSFSSALPTFLVAGFQQVGPSNGANSDSTTSVTEYMDTLSIVRGRHTLKMGADIRRESLDVLSPPNPTGAFTFNTSGTGNSVASLLLGQVNLFSIDIQKTVLQPRANIAEFFFADEWKVTDRLQLNIGTRYTLNFPSHERNGQGAVFNLNTQILEFPWTARDLECCDFGPRVGLAYRIGETWVIRSGYGLGWFEQSGITTPFTLPQFPFVQTLSQQSPDNIQPAFVLSTGPTVQPVPSGPNAGLGQGVFGTDRSHGSGYSQQWNLTVQKTFGQNLSAEAGYLGSKNTNLGVPDANINQLSPQYLALGSALLTSVPNPYYGQIPASSSLGQPTIAQQQLLRPYPRFTNLALFRDNIGHSTYHAIQAKLEKRLAGGLTFTAAYTFSKLIDDASSVFSNTIFTGPVLNTGVADAYNKRLERDLSSGDIPQVFSAGWTYQIPRVWKISGWEIAGIVRFQAGDRVAVSQGTNANSNLGFGVQRPNRVADPNNYANRSTSRWFDTTAFVGVPQFVIGNSSRNPVRGPSLQNADMMIGKTFRITERVATEFRAEAFNLTNTPPLGDPNGSFGSAAFGSITSAGNPRVFEFALKIHY
jgi:hypothetical protein